MFKSNESIKFMMAKIFLHMAEFSYKEISEPSVSLSYGKDILVINYVDEGRGKLLINEHLRNNEFILQWPFTF